MRAFHLLIAAGLLLVVMSPASAAQPSPKFFETLIVEDTAGDYKGNAALDLVAVYIGEKYQYDSDKQQGQETINFRFEVGNLKAIQCGTVHRYDLSFKLNGQPTTLYAGYTTTSHTDRNSCAPQAADGTGLVALREAENSIILIMPREALKAPIGSVMTEFYARSSIVAQSQVFSQDVAPMDNANAPSQAVPSTGLKSYTSTGTYAFITAVPTTPTEQYSVGGAEVKYSFEFITHPELKDDNIRVRFDFPSGWTISPSQGRTGSDPEGQLTAANDGMPRAFSFTLSSSGAANDGDTVAVVMEVITDSGGHLLIPTLTTVSGSKIVDPSLNFTLLSPGPFRAGETSMVRIQLANESGPILGAIVSVDLMQDGRRLSTTQLSLTDGVHQGLVRFPSEGTFTLDAYISSLKPSPHQEFVVQAEEGGLAPGAALMPLLLALVGAVAWKRRQE